MSTSALELAIWHLEQESRAFGDLRADTHWGLGRFGGA